MYTPEALLSNLEYLFVRMGPAAISRSKVPETVLAACGRVEAITAEAVAVELGPLLKAKPAMKRPAAAASEPEEEQPAGDDYGDVPEDQKQLILRLPAVCRPTGKQIK